MAIVGIVLFVLLLLAVPIGIALSSAAAAYIMVDPLLEPNVIFRQFFSFIARYSLTAIPLFIFAGFLMEKTGLIRQLFAFADSLVGHLPGGFGIAILIPPSIPLLIYGVVTETSVVRLFFAGVLPGLMLAAGYIVTIIAMALWLGLPRSGKFDAGRIWPQAKGALPALGIDRKSTRLNSSHQLISYAVFCL